jgi:hypothetical protein
MLDAVHLPAARSMRLSELFEQVRIFNYKRHLVMSRDVGRDAVFRDDKWTAIEVCVFGTLACREQSCSS